MCNFIIKNVVGDVGVAQSQTLQKSLQAKSLKKNKA